jgi:type II secretory pathway pseudopilin PulG
MMPIAIVGLVAVVAILAWRGSTSDKKRVSEKLRQAEATAKAEKRVPLTLEKDPKTGVYRARRD